MPVHVHGAIFPEVLDGLVASSLPVRGLGTLQKEVFWDVQLEFISLEVPSSFAEVKDMPERFQHILQKKVPPKVSKLRTFMSSCLMLMQDKYAIAKLQAMIEETPIHPRP